MVGSGNQVSTHIPTTQQASRPWGRRRPSYSISEENRVYDSIDQYTLFHLHPSTRPYAATISSAFTASQSSNLPAIFSSPVFAKFLAIQAKVAGATHALEVGTLGGTTSIWLASLNPSLRVTTLEYDEHHAKVARENIANAGLSDRITVHIGPALEALPILHADIKAGRLPPLGLTFIDADKPNNYAYYDWAIRLSNPGACIVVDNMVGNGQLVNPNPEVQESPVVAGARRLIEEAGRDGRVEGVVMQTVGSRGWDGFFMGVVL